MATTSVTLSGFVYDNAGNAVQDATVAAYTSADNATSAISGLTDTTDANGRWDLTTTDETKYPMDIKITFGSSVRWIKAGAGINVTRLTVSGDAVFGENDTGVDVTMYGATSGRYLLWDQSEDALHLNDSTELKIGSLAAGDMVLYHDGTNSYIKNATGALKIATETSGIAVTIGHTTSEVTIADNLTVTGNLTVSGTQTVVDTVTMNAANAVVFEGATADGYETTLTIEDPTADRTVVIPNVGGTLAVLAADSDTAITATPAELNLLDGGTSVGGSITIADTDGFVVNDGGTMKTIPASDINTYVGDSDTTYSAGSLLDLSGTTFNVDLTEASEAAIANGDYILFLDGGATGTQSKEAVHDLATLFAGTGLTASSSVIGVDASQAITALTGGDLTIYEDANNADVSLKMGTSATESLTIQVLNGGSNKTAEEVHFSTATASATADHGKMVFDIDGTDIATIDDGGVNVTSGSLETATIDYTDGDLAMTIADGGGVTFAQSATMANDATITLQDEGQIIFADDDPSTEDTGVGIVMKLTALTGLSIGELVHIDANGKIDQAHADATADMPAIGISLEANSSGSDADVKVLLKGVYKDSDQFNFTPGQAVYVDHGTEGDFQQTPSTTDGHFIQRVGIALTADSIYFDPSFDVIERD